MKKRLTAILVGAALLPLPAYADGNLFVTAGIGRADLSEDFDGFDVDTDSTAWRVTIGWRFNDYLAVEGGYQNFGRFEQTFNVEGVPTDVSLKADGFTIGATGNWPLSERFALFARAGAYFWDGDADINAVSAAAPEDTNLYFGGGVRFALSQRLSLMTDASRYELDGASSAVVSVGLEFSF